MENVFFVQILIEKKTRKYGESFLRSACLVMWNYGKAFTPMFIPVSTIPPTFSVKARRRLTEGKCLQNAYTLNTRLCDGDDSEFSAEWKQWKWEYKGMSTDFAFLYTYQVRYAGVDGWDTRTENYATHSPRTILEIPTTSM